MSPGGRWQHPFASMLPLIVVVALNAGCVGGGPTDDAHEVSRWQPGSAVAPPPSGPGTTGPVSPGSTASPPAAHGPTPSARTDTGNRPPASAGARGIAWRYAFPVAGRHVAYHPTHSAYPATDIFAACGTPVVAVTDGRVLEVSRVDRFREGAPPGPFNGGKSVSLRGDDGARYYGSHLTDVDIGIESGIRVRAGQRLGSVGRTGNANNVCHLHFGISPPCTGAGDWWIRRGVVWPAPFLDSWRRGADTSPITAVDSWHREHGCPPAR